MNEVRKIQQLNQQELENNVPESASWHKQYSDSSYIYIGGLPFELKEEDVITIFSQYGVPTFIKLLRDKETGDSKGFCFLKYEDQRSTILLVDNLNGIKLVGRTIKVDHCYYKPFASDDPQEMEKERRYEEKMNKLLFEQEDEKIEKNIKSQNLLEDGKSGPAEKNEADDDDDDDELADPMANFINLKKRSKSDHHKSEKRTKSTNRNHLDHTSHHYHHHHHQHHHGRNRKTDD